MHIKTYTPSFLQKRDAAHAQSPHSCTHKCVCVCVCVCVARTPTDVRRRGPHARKYTDARAHGRHRRSQCHSPDDRALAISSGTVCMYVCLCVCVSLHVSLCLSLSVYVCPVYRLASSRRNLLTNITLCSAKPHTLPGRRHMPPSRNPRTLRPRAVRPRTWHF